VENSLGREGNALPVQMAHVVRITGKSE
jgi:hypothetical protein